MSYELVVFDLGGVLVEVDADRLVHQVAQLVGRSFDGVQRAVYNPALLLPFEMGQISPQAYYQGLKESLRLPWTYEQFMRAWTSIFAENREVTRLASTLHKHYKLTVLTNTNVLHNNYIKATFPALSVIEEWVASCEVGLRKPDPQVYRMVLDRSGVEAHRAVYIDDRPELVEAGRAVGLAGIRFESSRQLERDLRALGLTL